MIGPLVSAEWLAARLGQPKLVVLDASLRKDRGGATQIPGTRVFDIDERVCDRASPLPHMLPSPEAFAEEAAAASVDRDSLVVVYDRAGVYASPRARWMFRAMGHDDVAVLDGGLPAWTSAGLPVEPRGAAPAGAGSFVSRPRPSLVSDVARVEAALQDPGQAVIDARSAARFAGRAPEPRPGLRSGHMPGALNLPFEAVLVDGRLRPRGELAALFAARVRPDQRLVFTCGSGVTACIIALAAELAGYGDLSVYDGSWSEWGLPSSRSVVSGDAP